MTITSKDRCSFDRSVSFLPLSSMMLRKDFIVRNENSSPSAPLKRAHSDPLENVKKLKTNENEDSFDDDEEDLPKVLSVAQHEGKTHPNSKQYLIYEKTLPTMISRTGRLWALKYRRVIDHVNPDLYDMYVHNDFVCYGELEVIENCLLDLEKDLFRQGNQTKSFVRSIHRFRRWEALILLLDYAHSYVGIDDGSRFTQLLRLIGACTVTILRQLLPKSIFNTDENLHFNDDDVKTVEKISERLQNWQEILEQTLILSDRLLSIGQLCSAYTNILQTVYCNWLWIIEKKTINWANPSTSIDIDSSLGRALVHAKQIKKNHFHESFNFLNELNKYRKAYPDLGGNSHDLRKWSNTRRNLYSYADSDDENAADFWLKI